MSRQLLRLGMVMSVACCAVLLSKNLALSIPIGKVSTPLSNKALTEKLGGSTRYLTFVSTDKPIYKIGEKVFVRGVVLNSRDHKPLPGGETASPTIEIKGPKGDTIATGTAQTVDSVWGFAWEIPEGQAGGEYTVHASYPWNGHAPAERKFDIRAYRAPRLKSQITFLRDGYAPGDKVNATLDVKRAEGGVPEGAKVTVIARIDGVEVHGTNAKVDSNGLCQVSFELPHEISRGEGTLALVIEDGGVVETASKSIPILLQTVDLQAYPEGGELIAGFKNRIYVQAKQTNGKPADLVAKIVSKSSSSQSAVGEFRTEHEGRGRFDFTPEKGRDYFLSISEPAGIKTLFPLPKIKESGAVIRSDNDTYKKGQDITLQVGCTQKKYRVTLSKHEEELAAYDVDLSDKSQARVLSPLSFKLPPEIDGVLTVTVWDEQNLPIAERLVFREAAKPLKISIESGKKSYIPGDNAELTVKATDADGKPVAAVVGVTVTDDSVLEMVEKREQAPHLPVMVFLEPEVSDLADAHVYMDANDPKAAIATDLLLGTQGWRRFALVDLAKFVKENGDKARRAVALKIQSQVEQQKVAVLAQFAAPGADFPVRAGRGGAFAIPPMAVPMAAMAAPNDNADGLRAVNNLAEADEGFAGELDLKQAAPANEESEADSSWRDKKDLQDALMVNEKSKKRAMIADNEIAQSQSALVLVREFAHEVRKDRKPTDRVDFADTLFWNAAVKTDAKTGEAKIKFGLNDSVSTFRVFADAFTGDGGVGTKSIGIESVQPFYAEAKLPLEVTSGDQILLPISLVNATNVALPNTNVSITLKGDNKLLPMTQGPSALGAGSRDRWIQTIDVGAGNGANDFVLSTKAGSYQDTVSRKLNVKPKGFPIEVSFGGVIEPGKPVVHTVDIPKGVVPFSVVSNTGVYPTPLANMTEALERMIQDPYGCFEQTSSTSYPLTMAQQYFLSHTNVNPKLVETSRQKLDAGYKKLVGFWCPDKGYEWFGENPGHEALTAFGLLHFSDMSKVRDVDQNMVASTRAWLLKQKDGQGGFSRKRRSLHTWIEDKDCSNAYIIWALLETGQSAADLKAELASLKTAADTSKNNYVVALAANAFYLAGDKAEAVKLMDRLAAKQSADGSLKEVTSSIVGSGGEALEVEGSSLATLAWLREPAYAGNVEKSIKYLADSCKAGRYGSTQSTVLALRAIVNYDKQRARPKAEGKVRVFVDGQAVGDWIEFNPSTQGAIKMPDLSELLPAGQHKIELRMDGGSPMPYSVAVKYNALTPASSPECKLDIKVKMAQDEVKEGSATEANVTVINKTKDALPTPIAIVGLPGGLEPRHEQLKELVKKGTIDAYEVLGREVVLYWRTMPAESKVEVPLSLIAAIPGTYTGPASRTYLYYTDEHKRWVDGMKVKIAAK